MKVIERKNPNEWSGIETTCRSCESRLLIEEVDLVHKYSGYDPRDQVGGDDCYVADCVVCHTQLYVSEKDIPQYVKSAVKLRQTRNVDYTR